MSIDTTVYQNQVQAINTIAQTYLNIQGTQAAQDLSAATLVKSGTGRVCTISITVAGSAAGFIYDANSASATTLPIFTIPVTAGIIVVNIPVLNGIVVAPGTGQHVTVSFS